jgi:hypothetical protein
MTGTKPKNKTKRTASAVDQQCARKHLKAAQPVLPKAAPVRAPGEKASEGFMALAKGLDYDKTKPGTLQVEAGDKTAAQVDAAIGLSPILHNLGTAINFSKPSYGSSIGWDMNALTDEMLKKLDRVKSGNMIDCEEMYFSQAVALDAIFTDMSRRAYLNIGTYIEPAEIYLRLGLRAQAQCAATLEKLAEMKNPRPVFINGRQVNVSTGQQQVNNTQGGPQQINNGAKRSIPSRAGKKQKTQIKLLAAE